jgi:hypothetical protein
MFRRRAVSHLHGCIIQVKENIRLNVINFGKSKQDIVANKRLAHKPCLFYTSSNLRESGPIISQRTAVVIRMVVNTPGFMHERPFDHETYFLLKHTQSYLRRRPSLSAVQNEGQLKP